MIAIRIYQHYKSPIPWVGGKTKLLWLLHKFFPQNLERFIDVFGGSGTVLLSRPIIPGCMEVYNDFNSNLVNLFACVKNRPIALLNELGFLPLNSRDEFNVLEKYLNRNEPPESYLKEELELTERLLKPPDIDAVVRILRDKAELNDVKRAADYFKLVRYSFSSNTKSFAGKGCDIRNFFGLIWECSRRLADVVIENKDFEPLIIQYDRIGGLIYCDPPYYEAEGLYAVIFTMDDHKRLHDVLLRCEGYVMVSYNFCPFICELYKDFYILHTKRQNSMSNIAGSEYEEVVILNYDPREHKNNDAIQLTLFPHIDLDEDANRYTLINIPNKKPEV